MATKKTKNLSPRIVDASRKRRGWRMAAKEKLQAPTFKLQRTFKLQIPIPGGVEILEIDY